MHLAGEVRGEVIDQELVFFDIICLQKYLKSMTQYTIVVRYAGVAKNCIIDERMYWLPIRAHGPPTNVQLRRGAGNALRTIAGPLSVIK